MEEKQALDGRIAALKSKLAETDYKAIKASEGDPSGDWAEIREKRKSWRAEIDRLQGQRAALEEE